MGGKAGKEKGSRPSSQKGSQPAQSSGGGSLAPAQVEAVRPFTPVQTSERSRPKPREEEELAPGQLPASNRSSEDLEVVTPPKKNGFAPLVETPGNPAQDEKKKGPTPSKGPASMNSVGSFASAPAPPPAPPATELPPPAPASNRSFPQPAILPPQTPPRDKKKDRQRQNEPPAAAAPPPPPPKPAEEEEDRPPPPKKMNNWSTGPLERAPSIKKGKEEKISMIASGWNADDQEDLARRRNAGRPTKGSPGDSGPRPVYAYQANKHSQHQHHNPNGTMTVYQTTVTTTVVRVPVADEEWDEDDTLDGISPPKGAAKPPSKPPSQQAHRNRGSMPGPQIVTGALQSMAPVEQKGRGKALAMDWALEEEEID